MAASPYRKNAPGSAGASARGAAKARSADGASSPLASTQPSAIADAAGCCTIAVRVIPRAKRSGFDGQREQAWLVRLAAPPVDGAANEALIALFAETFGVPKRSIAIVSGERAREKRVRIEGVSAAQAAARLQAL